MMTENEIDQLAEAVISKMKSGHHALWLDPEDHSLQHGFLKMLIEERADNVARRKRIQEMVAGSLVLSAILGLIGLIGAGILSWVRSNQ